MSKYDTVSLAGRSQEETLRIGSSLLASLYGFPCTIALFGDLGAGKTTFVKGLGLGRGLGQDMVSPTFALEQRYGKNGEELLHLDLYRLDPAEARRLVAASDDFPGIRVVEWSERLGEGHEKSSLEENTITVSFTESSPTTRTIEIAFHDLPIPDRTLIEQWRDEVRLPDHIRRHCDAVGAFARKLAEEMLRRGTVARPHALDAAGQLHDLLRFVDFLTATDRTKDPAWKTLGERYGKPHEEACTRFLEEHGYHGLARIVRPHGLLSIDHPERFTTIEQKLLFYADKRVLGSRIVTLDERFDEFVERYGKGVESEEAKRWRAKTKELESALFGGIIP